MPRSMKDQLYIPTLAEALQLATVEHLKPLAALLPGTEKPTRKQALVDCITQHLSGTRLRELWKRLDDLQQQAVRETIYAADGCFNGQRFRAKYGSMPHFGTKDSQWSYRETPSLLRLFLYSVERYSAATMVVPSDLRTQLLTFVPPPVTATLATLEELPAHCELRQQEYIYDEEAEGEDGKDLLVVMGKAVYRVPRKPPNVRTIVHQVPLTQRDMARAAQQDVQTVLRLIDQGKVTVSEKTLQPAAATMAILAGLLRDGDFYALQPKKDAWDQVIGPIRAFAWPLLVQGARLAELHGKKLVLTKAGRQALGAPPAETLRLLWQRWLKTTLLDELRRVDVIKGQSGKGRHSLTAVGPRRVAIVEALQDCPVGRWVLVDDFFRFMQATNREFEVTRTPWDLYVGEPGYGNLGDQGGHTWEILQGRYTLCLLFEYAATLGLLDVAYIPPAGVRGDFRKLWGTDDAEFFSRYDGLRHFRVNALGAYCLGLAETYVPSGIEAHATLSVLSSLRVSATGAALSPDEVLLLETYAEPVSDTVWQLSRPRAVAAVESGHKMAELRDFLQARDPQPLPETVESFLVTTERQARAMHIKGAAVLVECVDAATADMVASHEQTKKLCQRAGERSLVVLSTAEETFRQAVHTLGYGMPLV